MKEMSCKDNFHFRIVFILLFLFLPTLSEVSRGEKIDNVTFRVVDLAGENNVQGALNEDKQNDIATQRSKRVENFNQLPNTTQYYFQILFVAGAFLPVFLFHVILILKRKEQLLNLLFLLLLSVLFLKLKTDYFKDFGYLTIGNRIELFLGIWSPLLFFLYGRRLMGLSVSLRKWWIPLSLFLIAGCSLFFVPSENYHIVQIVFFVAVVELCIKAVGLWLRLVKTTESNLLILLFGIGLFFLICFTDLLIYCDHYELKYLVLAEIFLFFLIQMQHLLHTFSSVDSRSKIMQIEMRKSWQNYGRFNEKNRFQAYQRHKLIRRNWRLMIQRKKLIASIDRMKMSYQLLNKGVLFKERQTSMILHDLKHPLNVIMNLSEKEEQTPIDLKTIRRMSDRMLLLTQNAVNLQQMEESKIKIEKSEINLNSFVSEILLQYRSIAEGKKIEIIRRINKSLKVFADKELLRRVFVNLVSNAIQYSPIGGEINVSSRLFGTTIGLDISNQGPQFSEDEMRVLFDEEDSQGTILKEGSNGVGLRFCKMAIEMMGGKIGALNCLTGGVTFWVSFPQEQNCSSVLIQDNSEREDILLEREKLDPSENEKKLLKKLIEQLRTIPSYQISDIERTFSDQSFPSDSFCEFFKEKIIDMAYRGDAVHYEEFLNHTLDDIERKELKHSKEVELK